jgi:hypothetical protein
MQVDKKGHCPQKKKVDRKKKQLDVDLEKKKKYFF